MISQIEEGANLLFGYLSPKLHENDQIWAGGASANVVDPADREYPHFCSRKWTFASGQRRK